MVDERWVHTRLESALLAALVQAVELSVPAVAADAGAARVFDAPMRVPPAYVSTGRLGIHQRQEPAVHDWPMDPRSVFEQLRTRAPRDRAFLPEELLNGEVVGHDLFGPIAASKPIVDTLAAPFPVEGGAWCLLILFRYGDSAPFNQADLQRLERMRHSLAKALQRGLRQEMQREDPADELTAPEDDADSAASLLARLSRTERRVLSFLRSRYTERQIAEHLDRSPHTVHVHVKNIYRKFGISSRRQLLDLFEKR